MLPLLVMALLDRSKVTDLRSLIEKVKAPI